MIRPDRTLPASLRRGPFTTSQALAAGFPEDSLRRAGLRVPTPSVRTTSDPPDPNHVLARCQEFAPVLPPDAVFCHVTALAAQGAELPFGVDASGDLHVQVGPGRSLPRRRGLVGHRRATTAVPFFRMPGGVRVLVPELAWLQLATAVTPCELVVAGDALMRRRGPLCSHEQLLGAVAALPAGSRGVRRLRAAAEHSRPGTDSCMESRLRWLLVDAGLPCPAVNALVRDADGRVVAMPDLAYLEAKVAIEYDDDVHRTERRTWQRDRTRRAELESLGWTVIACTADDVLRHPERPVTWVRRALRRAR
ncbi:endonuclease domain-containing protein [Cellulomonas pakistanensis]|nr:DUF559 domain-containing protein [Cellulomonas pakistanensis]